MHVKVITHEVLVDPSPSVSSLPVEIATSEKSFYISELDGLRGLAALVAIFYHYLTGPGIAWHPIARLVTLLEVVPLNLDSFFILSGFLIGSILLRHKDSPNYYRTFYARRFHRILPLYYLWLAIYVIAFLSVGRGWGLAHPAGYSTAGVFGICLVLAQNFSPAIVNSALIIAPTWTLGVEEHFYLLAPVCVRRLSKRCLVMGLLSVIAVAPSLRGLVSFLCQGSPWSQSVIYLWTPLRADALAMGVLLALAWTAPEVCEWLRRRSHLLPWAMLAFTGTAAVLIHLIRIHVRNALLLNAFAGRTLVELSCLSLMLFVLTRPDSRFCGLLRTRFLRQSGKFSYCLYLAHFGVLWMISRFVMHSELGLRPWRDVASALISLPLLYVLATLSWKFIEEPLIRRGHRYTFSLTVLPPDSSGTRASALEYAEAGSPED